MSAEIWFYHLERTSVDRALPELLEKTLARGWRALVRSPDRGRLDHLNGWLWTYRDESFLPHGLAEEPDPERQPVLMTGGLDNPNGAHALFLLDDAEFGPLDGFERCVVMFDGGDQAALGAARARWREAKSLPGAASASYWRQSAEGRWEKQA